MLKYMHAGILYIFVICFINSNSVRSAPIDETTSGIVRRLVHEAKWAPFGTISTENAIEGYPMVNVIAIDDSDEAGRSTGVIKFILTDLDYTGRDWHANNVVTLLFTDALNGKCDNTSPMGHKCPRAYISGQVEVIPEEKDEYRTSLSAFEHRHPDLSNLPKDHHFYLAKLNIINISVFGRRGPEQVAVEDYYALGTFSTHV